ncbi:AAA family ATPase [Streptomyces sp. NPDC058623]|uniref:AAA family ATPase n=1 Tax=Streptomyces sp. NPDC058623 TaxID=3346563 RepID=UPI003650BEEA
MGGHAVRLADSNRGHHFHRERYTHTTVVAAERTVITAATNGLEQGLAQLTGEAAELTLATVEAANSTDARPFAFSPEQRAVVMRLLTAGHAVDAVIGVAGAGKTTLMEAARAGWEAAGLRVVGASTAAVAAANLSAEAGIDSRTIAAWTRDISAGRGLDGVGVMVIDEAAMVDDRALATLVRHAATTGTKVVAVGDPLQLRAVGIGGAFARVHQLVDGLTLAENRRQRDVVERAALQDWRAGGRTSALAAFAAHGRVHAEDSATDALAAMLHAWNQARTGWAGDPHGQLSELLLLAARREDVATLNAGARAALVATGELDEGRTYAVAGGQRIRLAVGDLVHIRRNDYRSRRDPFAVDVLNGFRGVVAEVDAKRGVLVRWRRPAPAGGTVTHEAWMSARDISEGRLTHAYAMTIGSAQGLTANVTLAYGLHADSHSLYPALSRARQESHLYLPLDELEDYPTRTTLGPVRTDADRLDRAVAAYGRLVADDGEDVMVTDELTRVPAARALVREEPTYTPWQQRPYGRLPSQHLTVRAEDEEAAAQRAEHRAGEHERQAAEHQRRLDAPVTPGGAFAAEADEVLARAGAWVQRAREEGERHTAAQRHAQSVRQILERIEQSAQKGRMALRLAGTSRRQVEALTEQYRTQHAAAIDEAQRAARASDLALREGRTVLADYPHISVLAARTTFVAPQDVQAMDAVLETLRARVPVLAARVDARLAEDVQQLRGSAAAQRAAAVRHREQATALRRESALRGEMRAAAPVRHAREADERAAAAQSARQAKHPSWPAPQQTFVHPGAGSRRPGV